MTSIMLTGAFRYSTEEIAQIEQLGYSVKYLDNEKDQIPFEVSDIQVVVCNALFQYHEIKAFKNLKVIQLTSAGLDRIPIEYIREHGIQVFNAKGVYSIPIAEFVLCGVLQLYKQSRFFYDNQKAHKWEKHRGLKELNGKTVCIVGAGNVGNEVAKRFKAFDCHVTGVDIVSSASAAFDECVHLSALDSILTKSEIVVLTLPLTDDTKEMFNNQKFDLFKTDSVFVNISRGAVVNEPALISALKSGKLLGAVLDVFCEEPLLKENPLWDMPNVIVTPHNSFVSEKTAHRLFSVIKENLKNTRYF